MATLTLGTSARRDELRVGSSTTVKGSIEPQNVDLQHLTCDHNKTITSNFEDLFLKSLRLKNNFWGQCLMTFE